MHQLNFPDWKDARVIVIDGVSILVSTSVSPISILQYFFKSIFVLYSNNSLSDSLQTLAIHSIVFREWFIDDRTRIGPQREPHYYNGIGLRDMTRFLSIIAQDTVEGNRLIIVYSRLYIIDFEDVDESLLDAVYHLQAKYVQVICEDWIWNNRLVVSIFTDNYSIPLRINVNKDAVFFLKMIIKVRGKYNKLDDAYVVGYTNIYLALIITIQLSLASLIFNHIEQGELVPIVPLRVSTISSTTPGTPIRQQQQVRITHHFSRFKKNLNMSLNVVP